MKSFKEFRSELHHEIKTKKAGLEHPAQNKDDENEAQVGKELLGIKVPVEVHGEFEGPMGNYTLNSKQGKYSLEKRKK